MYYNKSSFQALSLALSVIKMSDFIPKPKLTEKSDVILLSDTKVFIVQGRRKLYVYSNFRISRNGDSLSLVLKECIQPIKSYKKMARLFNLPSKLQKDLPIITSGCYSTDEDFIKGVASLNQFMDMKKLYEYHLRQEELEDQEDREEAEYEAYRSRLTRPPKNSNPRK